MKKIKRNFDDVETDVSVHLKKILRKSRFINSVINDSSSSSSSDSSPISKSEFVDLNLSSTVADYGTYKIPQAISITPHTNNNGVGIVDDDQLSEVSMNDKT